jgi:hypothetical protein
MPGKKVEQPEYETRSYVRKTPAGSERVVDLFLDEGEEGARFARLSMPEALSREETGYLSSQLRMLASGFAESSTSKHQG